jgi:hypothetical protein
MVPANAIAHPASSGGGKPLAEHDAGEEQR